MPIRMENVLLENMNLVRINQGNVQATNCIFNNCDHICLDFHETNSFNNCKKLDFFCSEKRSPSLSDNIINSDKLKINNIKGVNFELRGSIGKNVIFENIDFLNARPTFELDGIDRPETGEIKIKFNNVKIKDFGGLEINDAGFNRTKNINVELINSIIIANSKVTVSFPFSDAPIYISSIDYRYLKEINFIADSNSYIGSTLSDQQYLLHIEQDSWGGEEPGELPIINFVSGNYICMGATSLKNSIKNEGNLRFFSNPKPIVIFYGKKELILLIKSNKTLNSTPEAGKIKYLKYNGNWTLPTPSDLKDYTLHFDKQPVQYLPGMTLRQGGEWELRAYGLYSPKVYTSGTSTVTLKFDVFGNGSFDATIYCGGKLRREVDYIIYAMNQNSTPIDFRTAMKNGTYATWSTTEDKKGFVVHATNVTTGTYYIHFGIHSKESNYNSAYCYLNSIELTSNNVSFSNGEGDFSYTFTFDNKWNVCRNTWGNSKKLPLVSVKNSKKEWEYFYKDTNGIPPN